ESSLLPPTGVNFQLFFTDKSTDPVITMMARELGIDFSIVWGKLEDFRSNVYGRLVINVRSEDRETVSNYLDHKGVAWEVLN
ncbi:MAG: methionine ABC transporter ATP-binding protein, partial [Lachnospiraceae bacterium]|nr:methionine ABC transporter ATP-binding protein [Lachnospiraceae bacterium]